MFAHGQSPPLRDLADYGGKRTDVVDFGSGVDYGDHKWFQDKPSRPPVRSDGFMFLPFSYSLTAASAARTRVYTCA